MTDEFRPLIIVAALLLLIVTLAAGMWWTLPGCTITSVYDSGRVTTQYCPAAIPYGWHIAESVLIGAWTAGGFLAGAFWGETA